MFKNYNINLEEILSLSSIYFYWLDKNNIYNGCNDLYAKFVGLNSKSEIIGKKNSDLPCNKNNNNIAIQMDNNNAFIINNDIQKNIEESVISIDGSKKILLSYKLPLKDKNGVIIGISNISVDITNQKEKQKKLINEKETAEFTLEYILTHMPAHVYWKDKNGTYLGSNDLQAQSLGLMSGKEIIGKTDFELPWEIGDAQKFRENDLEVMKTGIIKVIEEQSVISGKHAIVLSQKLPLKNKQGEISGIIGISTDITKLKKIEQKLKLSKTQADQARSIAEQLKLEADEARKQAEEAKQQADQARSLAEKSNQLKTDFMMNMEHDLRTPCADMSLFMEALVNEEKDPKRKVLLNKISKEANLLLFQINGVLDFDRIQSGLIETRENKFKIKTLIQDIIEGNELRANNKGTKLIFNSDNNIPKILIGDDYKLVRIISNLLNNSIKFTTNGSITIDLILGKIDNKQSIIKIIIQDTGIGIPKDKQRYIFDKFYKIEPSNKNSEYQGSGLGLSIVKTFIKDLHGEIDLISELNKGTKFICTIPFKIPLLSDESDIVLGTSNRVIKFKDSQDENNQDNDIEYNNNIKGNNIEDNESIDNNQNIVLNNKNNILNNDKNNKENTKLNNKNNKSNSSKSNNSKSNINTNKLNINTNKLNTNTNNKPNINTNKLNIKTLLVEDDPIASSMGQLMLSNIIKNIDIAETGNEAILKASENNYDLIFLDFGLPDLTGLEVSKQILKNNKNNKTIIIGLTAHKSSKVYDEAIKSGMKNVMTKPINIELCKEIIEEYISNSKNNKDNKDTKYSENNKNNKDKKDKKDNKESGNNKDNKCKKDSGDSKNNKDSEDRENKKNSEDNKEDKNKKTKIKNQQNDNNNNNINNNINTNNNDNNDINNNNKDKTNNPTEYKPLNISKIEKNLLGNKEATNDSLKIYKSSINKDRDSIVSAYNNKDIELVKQIAHKLKGGAGYMEASRLFELCENIQESKETKLENIKDYYQDIVNEIDIIIKFLNEEGY